MMRQCPFTRCGRRIPPDIFSCYPDWMRLSRSQKSRIWEAFNKWKRGAIDGDELRRCQQAVIDEVEGRKAVTS